MSPDLLLQNNLPPVGLKIKYKIPGKTTTENKLYLVV
jgi:hypothetical protein